MCINEQLEKLYDRRYNTLHFIVKDLHICCDGHEIEELIADNEGYYHASFEFDEEWDNVAKTARFICDTGYADSLIGPDNTCLIPSEVLHCPGLLRVGAYAGVYEESLLTTNVAYLRLSKSIFTDSTYGLPDDPSPSIYTQIANAAADALKIAMSVEERANNGEFNGRDGADGTDGTDGEGADPRHLKLFVPGTEYKAGDFVIANIRDEVEDPGIGTTVRIYTSVLQCLRDLITPNAEYIDIHESSFSEDWIYAGPLLAYSSCRAERDEEGRHIIHTYATKEELNSVVDSMEGILDELHSYARSLVGGDV